MSFLIKQMSPADYAQLQELQGARIVQKGGIYWRQVRPLFFRPVVPSQELVPGSVTPPCAWPGGYQFATTDAGNSNSRMSFLIYDDLRTYALENVSHNRRRLIRNAAKLFEVRPLTDVNALKAQGHSVYVSFFERTRYKFKSDRVQKDEFDRWADTLFSFPAALVLGAFGPSGLAAVSVSFWVETTLVYASLFSESESMRKGVCELLLHELRASAATHTGISSILVRPYHGGSNHDQYYLIRGCRLVHKPALLCINPATALLLRRFAPGQYDKLLGNFPQQSTATEPLHSCAVDK